MTCLLDTCTFLWLTDQTQHLSPAARAVLEDPVNTLVVSQISSLEIQIKYNRGKLPLGLPPEQFIAEAMARHGLHYLRLADEHIWATSKLPLLHGDPFDRLLVAQASYEGMSILTPHPHIAAYPISVIW